MNIKPARDRRNRIIQVRLTRHMFARVKRAARALRMRPSSWVRDAIAGYLDVELGGDPHEKKEKRT